MIIYTDIDLKKAIQRKESTIHVKDENIGNSFLLASKIQDGHLPIMILKRLEGNRVCNVSVGEGTIIPVTKEMVPYILMLWETIVSEQIEIDVEEVIGSENQSVLWELKVFNKKRTFYSMKSKYSFYLYKR